MVAVGHTRLLVLVGQVEHLVGIGVTVDRHIPVPVLLLDDLHVHIELEARVAQFADVVPVVGAARRNILRTLEEQTVRHADEVVHRQVDAVVQQTHVQTQIERLLLLPRQIGIAVVIDLRTQLAFGNGNRILVGIGIVVGQVLVTLRTVRRAEFQFRKPVVGAFHEFLGPDAPRTADGPESAPRVVFETRGSVAADTAREIVAVVVIVLQFAEEALNAQHVLIAVDRPHFAGIVQLRVFGVVDVGLRNVQIIAHPAVVLVADQCVDAMASDRLFVVEHLNQVQIVNVRRRFVDPAVGSASVADRGVVEKQFVGSAVAQRSARREGEVAQEIDLPVGPALKVVTLDVARIHLQRGDDVLARGSGTGRRTVGLPRTQVVDLVAVFIILDIALGVTRVDRIHRLPRTRRGKCGTCRRTVLQNIVLNGMGIGEVGAHLDPLAQFGVDVHTGAVTLESRLDHVGFVLEVTQRNKVVRLVVSAADRHVRLVAEPRLEEFVLQALAVHAPGRRVQFTGRRVDQVGRGIFVRAVVPVCTQHLLRGVERRGSQVAAVFHPLRVAHRAPLRLEIFARIGDDVILGDGAGVDTESRVDTDRGIIQAAALGRDENHAVGGARTVERVGRSVLRHGNRLDVGRVDVGQAALIGRAVEHDQRTVARIERTDAADIDRSIRTGLVGGRSQLHAGNGSFEHFRNGRNLTLRKFLTADGRDRPRKVLFRRRAESGHHDIFDGLRIFVHHNVDMRLSGNSHFLRLVTDERNRQRSVGGCGDGEFTVRARGRTGRRTVDHNRCARDRLAFRIGNFTGNLPVLGESIRTKAQNGN